MAWSKPSRGNGKAELKKVSGGKLWAEMKGPANIIRSDEVGGYPNISTEDVYQTNSLIHVIDRVLMPK